MNWCSWPGPIRSKFPFAALAAVNEMLLVALYLYPELPDVDFIIHFGDGCAYDHPVIQWNICK
jgi:hypothetical protein